MLERVASARDPRHRIACGLAGGEARAVAAVFRRSRRPSFARRPGSGEDGRAPVIETEKRIARSRFRWSAAFSGALAGAAGGGDPRFRRSRRGSVGRSLGSAGAGRGCFANAVGILS